jgi:diketogulonate reductase-like aldo/keto reductase
MGILNENYTLYNGVTIPKIGYGTWQIPNAVAYDTTLAAFRAGYRHVDSAKAYQNEKAVGRAVRESGIPRNEIFVTSKLPAQTKGYQVTLDAFAQTMKDLDLEVLDLYLIHAPWPWDQIGKDCTQGNIDSWKAMEQLYKDGKVRAIGVSNFSVKDIQALIDHCEILPMVNQIPFYVGHTQKETMDFCKAKGILVEAYSPLATGGVFDEKLIKDIAEANGVTIAQLCIAYCLQKDTLPLPKTTKEFRMVENAKVDFIIGAEDMAKLDAFDKNLKRYP